MTDSTGNNSGVLGYKMYGYFSKNYIFSFYHHHYVFVMIYIPGTIYIL